MGRRGRKRQLGVESLADLHESFTTRPAGPTALNREKPGLVAVVYHDGFVVGVAPCGAPGAERHCRARTGVGSEARCLPAPYGGTRAFALPKARLGC